ncbi:MAG: hypothetical protein KKH22_04785, partial [Proteobacteria bacterium]|nr:hypothetical protein [Pseudomonadota bacterium]
SGQGPAASTDYQSLYAAPSAKSTFAQTLAQTQSSSFSLTTAEGDLVTLSSLSQNYQYTQAVGWYSPTSSKMNYSSSSTSAEAMGISVQGDLNAQELGDITRLVSELTSIASVFFSGDQEGAMTRAMAFGQMSMGSVTSLAASFSNHTVSQTTVTSHSALPAMADLKDLFQQLEANSTDQRDYAELLEARWKQILKALDEMKEKEMDGLFARREQPQSMPVEGVNTESPSVPPVERVAGQMLDRMEEFLGSHPKLIPFAGPLASSAMEKAASREDQARASIAGDFFALQNAFRNQLEQWFLPPQPQKTTEPLTEA